MATLQLTDDLIFALGGRRVCYVHPHDASRCVKVFGVNGDPRERRRKAVWYKRCRPLYWFDDNRREWSAFRELMRHDEAIWTHFPRCYGLIDTSMGLGIVTELLRDSDGTIVRSLPDFVAAEGRTPELMQALEAFYAMLRRHLVITRDILDHNLVVQRRAEGLRIVMIDGFGSAEMLPLSSWFRALGRRKVERKIARFKDRYHY
jgi:hypothetical protein